MSIERAAEVLEHPTALSHPIPYTEGMSMAITMSNRHPHHATGPDMLQMRIDRLATLA